ncbi:MAG TPA: hypothetical protein VGF48_25035 [Thermoanaerobaculia bacterium]
MRFLPCWSGDGEIPAHRLPDLERMQRRLHAGDAELRRLRAEMDEEIGGGRSGVVVIGKHNPELFMPWELMAHVVGFLADEERFARYVPRWADRGAATRLGDDYLPRLQKIVGSVIAAENERERLQLLKNSGKASNPGAVQAEWSRANASLCPLRAEALAAARAEFGREAFDRFLYEAVAPDVIIIGVVGHTAETAVDTSQWIEAGCK